MRRIDADLLQEELENEIESAKRNGGRDIIRGLRIAARRVKHAPAIDAVPVVLCDDCYWRSATGYCRRYGHSAPDGFFCADGRTAVFTDKRPEKKTEERCLATGGQCSKCTPGPCDHRRTVIADDSGQ
jgi:hypothetical protein